MRKKYIVRLSAAERATLEQVIKKLNGSSQKVRRAQILLKSDADGPGWTDAKIAEAYSCRTKNGREHPRAVGDGGVRGRAQWPVAREVAPAQTARWRAGSEGDRAAAGSAPGGICELDVAVVGRTDRGTGDRGNDQPRDGASNAQKNGMTNRKIEYWVIPSEADGEFVACMEDVLETYAQPYDSRHPVLCMDEQPVQLLNETRTPIAATKEHPRRVDYEYERAGTASIFMFCEPLAGWRQVTVRERRTKIDWALEVEELLRTRYAAADKVILVCDNLNTDTKGAFYEALDPETARSIVRRLEFRHTPKHGSWLNVAENELSSMTRQCIRGRRFGTIETLRAEIAAWQQHQNVKQRGVDWQFRIADARTKFEVAIP
jgi:DDE superfamily endonuclease